MFVCLFTGTQTSLAAHVKVQCKVANPVGHKVTTHWTHCVPAGAGAAPRREGHGSVFGPQGIPAGANSSKTTRTQCEAMKSSERLPPRRANRYLLQGPRFFPHFGPQRDFTPSRRTRCDYPRFPFPQLENRAQFRLRHKTKGQPLCRFLLIRKFVGSDCWKNTSGGSESVLTHCACAQW